MEKTGTKECLNCKQSLPKNRFRKLHFVEELRETCMDCSKLDHIIKARKKEAWDRYEKEKDLAKREYIRNLKMTNGCMDCGYNLHPEALEFDHTENNKIHSVADLISRHSKMEAIIDEIAKCEIVCANCHRIRTFNRRHGN